VGGVGGGGAYLIATGVVPGMADSAGVKLMVDAFDGHGDVRLFARSTRARHSAAS
jgi:hypothetical protein